MSATRRALRSRDNRIFAGVCGGLDESLGVSALALRILFLIATLASGIGVVVYLLVWALMPLAPKPEPVRGSFERTLDKADSHLRVGKKLIGVVTTLATFVVGAGQQVGKYLPDTKQQVATDTASTPARYDSDLLKMLEQSAANPPQQTQAPRPVPKPQPPAPVVQVSDDELLDVIEASNDAQVEALRGGNRDPLYDFLTGEALARQVEYLDGLRAQNLKEYATLLGSTVSWIKKEGKTARVHVVERWRSELHAPDGSCVIKPEHAVPQTVHLQLRGDRWKVSAISFESAPDAGYHPCF